MNRPIRHVVAVLMGLFTILFIQLNRIQVIDADELQTNDANTRTIQRDFNKQRGRILTADEVVVASSTPTPGEFFDYQRTYPQAELYAHITGYWSSIFGAEGVELTFKDHLIGASPSQELRGLTNPLDGRDPIGDIYLTIDHDLQKTAREALGNRRGAVVALDPVSGAIRAMWSYPSFDPNRMAANDGALANEAWTELVNADGKPLLSKAYQEIYAPGSTFKVITAAAALEANVATLDVPAFAAVDSYVAPLTSHSIRNFGGSTCGGNLVQLLVVSCNAGFAELGAEFVGPDRMVATAENFGFNNTPELDLPAPVASRFPDDYGSQVQSASDESPAGVFEDTPLLAQAAIGQYEVAATPLQMALVAAAVANGGPVPQPHVVAEVRDVESGRTTDSFGGRKWRDAMSTDRAIDLTKAMIEVVETGTAKSAAVPGVLVGAKTGTAQVGTDPPRSHAWMIAFAGQPEQAPELAIAVFVEGVEGSADQTGGGTAGPIVRSILEQFFS